MRQLTDFAAFIFDMDGLVLDTEPTYFAAWQQAAKLMGYQLEPELFIKLSGSHYNQVEAQLIAEFGVDFDLLLFRQLGTESWNNYVHKHGIMIKKGVTELLDYARQQSIPIALATNSSAVYAHQCLNIAGIRHRFPVIVTGEDVRKVKPAPDIFLKAAERMQVDISQCIIFEDSHTGITAASASGAYSAYVPSTYPVNPLTVSLANCLLADLVQAIESLPA
jgi:beta-phosphoglucomutase